MKKKHIILLSLLIVLYLINGICSINALSITADEGSHLAFGIKLLKGDPARTHPEKDNSKMPVSVLNAIPRAVEQVFNKSLTKTDWGVSDTIKGRYITLFFSVLIILLVFTWSRKLYGVHAGLFSAFLFACCPNNIANAVLVTTDTYSVFFLLATMYFLWRYCNTKSNRHFIWFAVMLGLSQLVKQSLFHLYILTPLCVLVYALVMKENFRWLQVFKKVLIVITISWIFINAGFIFWHMNTRLGDYQFMSALFQRVQQLLPGWIPVPVSESFVSGLDQAKYYDQVGGGLPNSSFANVTILGKSSTGGSFWYYYFVSMFFKTPIPYLVMIGWGKYLLFTRTRFRDFMRNEFFLFVPVVYFLLLMSFLYNTQCGIRHIIFIYPLLFIFCGIIIKYTRHITEIMLLIVLSLWLVISVGRYFNNYYPYTNEFVGPKKNAYKYVGASNLNFDQATYLVKDYLKRHPEVKPAPQDPQPGKFILVVDRYLDTWNTGKYQWLRKLKPVAEVHFSYLLFDVQPEDLEP
ncbi:MAG TPA: glycosyltransferase family 39 protein [Ferruginibacter sp.]|nr:glycosyltransferase family 39 protein [Ferruginibacter sp.]